MSTRRKISVRRVLQFFVTVIAVTGFVLAMSAAANRQDDCRIMGADLRITNPRAAHFLDKAALEEMLFSRRHINPTKLKLEAVDLRRLERQARTNPWVANAQAYVDGNRILHVRVTQRVPVVRLFGRDGSSHYLDTALKPLPVSVGYAHYIPVVTGVPTLGDDSAGRAFRGQIVWLVNRLARDSFWSAQVSEIAVSPDARGFEIVPVLGNHRILLGDTSRLDAKLKGLFSFYKGVLNRVGWDKYTLLDVRYRGQVVASPALQWKAPVDRAATNMNWVKTIIGDESASAAVRAGSVDSTAKSSAAPMALRPVPAATKATTATQQRAVSPANTAARPSPQSRPASGQTARTNTPAKAVEARKGEISSSQPRTRTTSTREAPKPATRAASGARNTTPKPTQSTSKPKYVLPKADN
jgi:cell division protein FtsQ